MFTNNKRDKNLELGILPFSGYKYKYNLYILYLETNLFVAESYAFHDTAPPPLPDVPSSAAVAAPSCIDLSDAVRPKHTPDLTPLVSDE